MARKTKNKRPLSSSHSSSKANTTSTDVATDANTKGKAVINSDAADGAVPYNSILSDGARPEDWSTGSYPILSSLIAEAKGAASKAVVQFIKKQQEPLVRLWAYVTRN